jgi:hypothetical protein
LYTLAFQGFFLHHEIAFVHDVAGSGQQELQRDHCSIARSAVFLISSTETLITFGMMRRIVQLYISLVKPTTASFVLCPARLLSLRAMSLRGKICD